MSGIYIPGMEMPTEEAVAIFVYPDGRAHVWRPGYLVRHGYDAIPAPDRWRLCNKDDVLKVIDNLIGRTANKEAHEVLKWAKECLSVLPTIIPVEEGE